MSDSDTWRASPCHGELCYINAMRKAPDARSIRHELCWRLKDGKRKTPRKNSIKQHTVNILQYLYIDVPPFLNCWKVLARTRRRKDAPNCRLCHSTIHRGKNNLLATCNVFISFLRCLWCSLRCLRCSSCSASFDCLVQCIFATFQERLDHVGHGDIRQHMSRKHPLHTYHWVLHQVLHHVFLSLRTFLTSYACDEDLTQQDGEARVRGVPFKPTRNKKKISVPLNKQKTDHNKETKHSSEPHSHSAWPRVGNPVQRKVRCITRIHFQLSTLLWNVLCAVYVSCIWCAVSVNLYALHHTCYCITLPCSCGVRNIRCTPTNRKLEMHLLAKRYKEMHRGPRKTKLTVFFWTAW